MVRGSLTDEDRSLWNAEENGRNSLPIATRVPRLLRLCWQTEREVCSFGRVRTMDANTVLKRGKATGLIEVSFGVAVMHLSQLQYRMAVGASPLLDWSRHSGRPPMTCVRVPSLEPPAVITASEPHTPYPHKTTERDRFADAAHEAVVAEADDALLLTHEGWVAEGTAWNLCWWDAARLCTPPLALGSNRGSAGRGWSSSTGPRSRGVLGRGWMARACFS